MFSRDKMTKNELFKKEPIKIPKNNDNTKYIPIIVEIDEDMNDKYNNQL